MGRKKTSPEMFMAKVAVTDKCWEWLGHIESNGYGRLSVGDRPISAHRYAYQVFVGPIADGLAIDHLCSNRKCVKPSHLEAVTPLENVRRALMKNECSMGHKLEDPNLTYRTCKGRVTRECRACHNRRANEYQRRKRNAGGAS